MSDLITFDLSPEGAVFETTGDPPQKARTPALNLAYHSLDYDQSTSQRALWFFPLHRQTQAGLYEATLNVELHWTSTAAVGNVEWAASFAVINEGDVIDKALSAEQNIPATAILAAGQVHQTLFTIANVFSAVTDPDKSAILVVRLRRLTAGVVGNAEASVQLLKSQGSVLFTSALERDLFDITDTAKGASLVRFERSGSLLVYPASATVRSALEFLGTFVSNNQGDGVRPTVGASAIAHWRGDSLLDSTANGNDLQLASGHHVNARFALRDEEGWLFDNATRYTLSDPGDNANFALLGEFSFEAIVQLNDKASQCLAIFAGAGEGEAENALWQICFQGSTAGADYGKMALFWEEGAGVNVLVLSDYGFPQKVPFHLAITRSATGEVAFYCNGVIVGTKSGTNNMPTGGGNSTLLIGNDFPLTQPFTGYMADVMIYGVENDAAGILGRARQAIPSVP